jgi:hypothetical protein
MTLKMEMTCFRNVGLSSNYSTLQSRRPYYVRIFENRVLRKTEKFHSYERRLHSKLLR